MGTDKRDRQKANRNAKIEAERAAEARARRNQTIRNVVIAGVLIVAVMFILSLTSCSSSDNTDVTTKGTSASGDEATTTASAGAATADYGTGACAPKAGASAPKIDFDDAPKKCIDPSKSYTATVKTSEGTVVLELSARSTPVTVNNFVNLARWGYFDDTVLFRTEAASGIIQGGSPHTQDNSDGGPGYTIPDEGVPYASADYGPGTIAMANTGQPHSASAQFFFLANEGGRYLGDQAQVGPSAGSYVPFGKATKGLNVLVKISALESSPGSGIPGKKVTIDKVTITES